MSIKASRKTNKAGDSQTQSLTIYLIKEQFSTPADIIEDGWTSHQVVKLTGQQRATLYIKSAPPKPPKWARIFKDQIDSDKIGLVASTAAVLLTRIGDRSFALTFGHGRHLLKSDCWEERFGLRVALNCIEEGKLRSLDKQTFDAITRHTREQASIDSSLENFGLDIDQDLLRAVTGVPHDKVAYGNRMSGADSLHVSLPATLANLPRLLTVYLEKFQDHSYQEHFSWVDQIGEIREIAAVTRLDAELIRLINDKQLDRIWMSVPEVVDWSKIDGFLLGKSKECGVLSDIHLPKFLKTIPSDDVITIDLLKSKKIYSVDGEGTEINEWQAYRCLYAELIVDGDTFLLSAGKWYRVTRDFVQEVNTFYKNIDRYTGSLPAFAGKSEEEYNKATFAGDENRFALMDRQCIKVGASRSKVEFCDLLSNKNEIIHVKRYGASSVLSHLFSQGVVSGELFLMEEEFRKEVNKRLPKKHRVSDFKRSPNRHEYQVVFAVISDSKGDLELPFFSKLNLKHAVRRLGSCGYRVAIAKIEVAETYAKLEKFTTKSLRRNRKQLKNDLEPPMPEAFKLAEGG